MLKSLKQITPVGVFVSRDDLNTKGFPTMIEAHKVQTQSTCVHFLDKQMANLKDAMKISCRI